MTTTWRDRTGKPHRQGGRHTFQTRRHHGQCGREVRSLSCGGGQSAQRGARHASGETVRSATKEQKVSQVFFQVGRSCWSLALCLVLGPQQLCGSAGCSGCKGTFFLATFFHPTADAHPRLFSFQSTRSGWELGSVHQVRRHCRSVSFFDISPLLVPLEYRGTQDGLLHLCGAAVANWQKVVRLETD